MVMVTSFSLTVGTESYFRAFLYLYQIFTNLVLLLNKSRNPLQIKCLKLDSQTSEQLAQFIYGANTLGTKDKLCQSMVPNVLEISTLPMSIGSLHSHRLLDTNTID